MQLNQYVAARHIRLQNIKILRSINQASAEIKNKLYFTDLLIYKKKNIDISY